MSQDELIQHIQIKHGVTLGKDDPILMLQTMLDGFSRELEQKQAVLLSDTKHQIEDMLVISEAKTKELAERLINIAIEEGDAQLKKYAEMFISKFENVTPLSNAQQSMSPNGRMVLSKSSFFGLLSAVLFLLGFSAGIFLGLHN